MHSLEEWHRHAGHNMTAAEAARHKAIRHCTNSRRCHEQTNRGQYDAFTDLRNCMEAKVGNSCKMIELLEKREASLLKSIQLLKQSHMDLEAAQETKDNPLRLCLWRLDRRSRRPKRELVKDRVDEALEAQRTQLIDTQRKLADAAEKTLECIAGLERKLEQVRDDAAKKRQALGVDEMCLRSTHRTLLEKAPPNPAKTPPVDRKKEFSSAVAAAQRRSFHSAAVSLRESAKNEEHRMNEAVRLEQSAATQELAAKAMREKHSKLIHLCDGIAKMAAAKAGQALQERINENQQMRLRLVAAIKDTQEKILHTKKTMGATKDEMRSIQDPINLCRSCHTARKHRKGGEHIQDPVTSMLIDHETALMTSNEELRRQHQCEKLSHMELKQRIAHLQEDLQDKSEALRIDVSCLTNDSVQYQFSSRNSAGNGANKEFDLTSKAKSRGRSSSMGRRIPQLQLVPGSGEPGKAPLTAR